VEFRFEQLVGCGEGVQHGDTENRTMYATAEVDGNSDECESEEQTRRWENTVVIFVDLHI
jgi:hypothetical protein